jgi:hypothetical protein
MLRDQEAKQALQALLVESTGVVIAKKFSDHVVEVESLSRPVGGGFYRCYISSGCFSTTIYTSLIGALGVLEGWRS